MASVKFKYSDDATVYPKLIQAVNSLCVAKGKDCTCTSGFRSPEKQRSINAESLRSHKDAYQKSDGSVWTKDGKCWAAAYGKSNHCYCIAMDISDDWFEKLTNKELAKYGLIKPIDYEPWHVQLCEHQGISQAQKEAIRESVLKGKVDEDMNVKGFQNMVGLTADGVIGPKTKEKAKEIYSAVRLYWAMNTAPLKRLSRTLNPVRPYGLGCLKQVKYFDSFIMNIVKKMGGAK